jgi:DNA-binding PadR family transcriptional regulator
MTSGKPGQFERSLLAAILSLRDDAYGVTIREKVQGTAGSKAVSLGTVYFALDRMEDRGEISSWLSDPAAGRGDRRKRYYRIEALGERLRQASWPVPVKVWLRRRKIEVG